LQPTKSKKEKPKHLVETDLDDNNMDNELAKISADPQKRCYTD